MVQPDKSERRWNVILSGLLIGTLAVIVTFTNRAAFLSPIAVVVVTAIGVVALMLQLRFRYREMTMVRAPMWLNIVGTVFALTAFFGDFLRLSPGVAEVVARGDGTEGALAAAIDRVLASEDLRQAAASHGIRLQATDPPGTAATLLESLTVAPRTP